MGAFAAKPTAAASKTQSVPVAVAKFRAHCCANIVCLLDGIKDVRAANCLCAQTTKPQVSRCPLQDISSAPSRALVSPGKYPADCASGGARLRRRWDAGRSRILDPAAL